MSINPLGGAGPSGSGPLRPDATNAGKETGSVDPRASGGTDSAGETDQLDLTDSAAALLGGDTVPSGTLSSERLKELTQQLAAGDFSSDAAATRLADRMTADPTILNS